MKHLFTLGIYILFVLSLIIATLSTPPTKNNEKTLLVQDEDPNIIIIGVTGYTVHEVENI